MTSSSVQMKLESLLITVFWNVLTESDSSKSCSIWFTPNGTPVMSGGKYPDENDISYCIADCLSVEIAELTQERVANELRRVGLNVVTELVTND